MHDGSVTQLILVEFFILLIYDEEHCSIFLTIGHTFPPGKYCIKFHCILWPEGASLGPSKQLRFPLSLVGVSICEFELQM
jgi:hypothetical protein